MRKPTINENETIKKYIEKMNTENQFFIWSSIPLILLLIILIYMLGKQLYLNGISFGLISFLSFLVAFLTGMIIAIFKIKNKISELKRKIENLEYTVEDCIAKDLKVNFQSPRTAKQLEAKVKKKNGNISEEFFEILNEVEFRNLDEFVKKYNNTNCILLHIHENTKYILMTYSPSRTGGFS